MKLSDPFKILSPNERWAPSQSQIDAAAIYIKQEKWEDVKNELKSFKDVCKLFEIK